MEAPKLTNEPLRLEALRACQILDTAPEEVFDSITQLAAYICRTPISLVSLVDESRQWFKSHTGLEVKETPRQMSFCAYAILQSEPFIIPDATRDPRFADNPLVTGPPNIRFYAAAPLFTSEGFALGTLCVIDTAPRELDEHQRYALKALSQQVLAQIETKRALLELAATMKDLKKTQQALQKSDEMFSKAFRSGPDPMTISTLDEGRYVEVNDAFVRLSGHTFQEAIGRTATDLNFWLSTSDRMRFVSSLQLHAPVQDAEVRFRAKNGEIRDALLSADIVEMNGQPFILSIVRDITARKQYETAIKESAERYRLLFERNLAGVYRTTTDGRILDCNDSFARMLGYESRQDVLNKSAAEFYVTGSDRDAFLDLLRQNQILTNTQTRLKRRDGSIAWILENVSLITKDGTQVIEGTAVDISSYKQLEEQFWQAQKMEGIGRVAGGVAHDFNNLLSIITGYTQIIADGLELGSPLRDKAGQILKASARAATLIRQLLAFSRKQVLTPQVLDLNKVLSSFAKMLPQLIGEDIHLQIVRGESLGKVKTDPAQIEQILMNLAVNARDAMPAGGKLTIETANITLDDEYAKTHPSVQPGKYVMLSVTDTGTGMSEETRQHLFEPFYTTKEVGKGTGLGLSTIYGIVKQSGGNIWVYSELERGTSFKIFFPSVAGEETAAERKSISEGSPRGTETVLVVEDEGALRTLAVHFLESKGYTVLDAADAVEALEAFRRHPEINLLLTDIIMPGLNGRKLSEQLSQRKPDLKVLFTSGYDASTTEEGGLNSKTRLLQKPFSLDALARAVRDTLDGN